MRILIASLFLITTIIVYGCADETNLGPGNCPNDVSLSVQLGETPVFSWQPACEADGFIVSKYFISASGLEAVTAVWSIQADTIPFPPPLTYGVAPMGVPEDVPAEPLEEGKKYRVWLTRNATSDPGFAHFDPIAKIDFIYVP